MPLFICAHGPRLDVHRFPGYLIVFANDKAVYSLASQKDIRIVHPPGYLRPDLGGAGARDGLCTSKLLIRQDKVDNGSFVLGHCHSFLPGS